MLVEPGSYKTPIWSKGMNAIASSEAYREKTEHLMGMVRKVEKTAGDPKEVSDLICKIVKEDRPAFRWPIGKGVKAGLRARNLLPWRLLEKGHIQKSILANLPLSESTSNSMHLHGLVSRRKEPVGRRDGSLSLQMDCRLLVRRNGHELQSSRIRSFSKKGQ